MGRYSLSLAKAMIAEAGMHEVVIVMSTAFPQELARLRREFRGLLPAESIILISMPPGTAVGGNRPWLLGRKRETMFCGRLPYMT
jgi:hypothetical protein